MPLLAGPAVLSVLSGNVAAKPDPQSVGRLRSFSAAISQKMRKTFPNRCCWRNPWRLASAPVARFQQSAGGRCSTFPAANSQPPDRAPSVPGSAGASLRRHRAGSAGAVHRVRPVSQHRAFLHAVFSVLQRILRQSLPNWLAKTKTGTEPPGICRAERAGSAAALLQAKLQAR